ncbi:MAG: hypothetical protein NVS9B10_26590 [Nevskia sp.]
MSITLRQPFLRRATAAGVVGLLCSGAAHAISFSTPVGDEELKFVLNNTLTAGAGIRTSGRNVNLIGKSNLNPNVCGIPYNSCQGVFKDQIYPAQHLVAAPGAASVNSDDGDLNYAKGTLFQAPVKISQDLTIGYKEFGIFARTLYFYDAINNDFREYHPNRITSGNINDPNVGIPSGATGALLPYPGAKVFGPGAVVRNHRSDGTILSQAGTHLQTLDSYLYGKLPLWSDKELTFKIGRQNVNWGESTTLVINSINQANPLNANNYLRIGSQTEEIFTPINQAFLSFEPISNLTVEGFYQLEWKNVESQTPGTYFSTLDVGTNYTVNNVSASYGGGAEDPEGIASLQYNPLARITPTTLRLQRRPDHEPKTGGQFGIELKYYAENLNNGTELGFYFMNYHSRLPYGSFYSSNASCARREGNALGIDATDPASFLRACPNIPQFSPGNPAGARSDAVPLDTAQFQLEYPENIKLFGLSFNTTLGAYSLQGEVAFRPNLPLQVDLQDLAFAAFGPTLTRCHDPRSGPLGTGCVGSTAGTGENASGGTQVYGSSNFTDANGRNPYPDSFDLLVGHVPGSARSFPNFIIPYRGGVVGENPPNSYIRGYERFAVYQFNLGATRVLGASDNWLGADQVILVGEAGATYVPGLPSLDQLQFEAPGTNYNASAGADGSGANGSRLACSTNPTCTIGADGLRFNPHQQDPTGFPDKFSWGYRIISIIRYESVLPGISIQPTVILSHDVQGTAPLIGDVFVAGRKSAATLIETRYKSAFSVSAGYTWYWGGGVYNLLSDRDFAQVFLKYQF